MGGNSGRKVRPQVVGSEDSRPRRIIATGQALAQPESRSWVERRLIDAQLTAIEEASREVLETLDYPTALDTLAAEAWSSSEQMTPPQRKQRLRAFRAMQALLYADQTRRFLDERNCERAAYAAMQAGAFSGDLITNAERGFRVRQSAGQGGREKARTKSAELAARDHLWLGIAVNVKKRHPDWSRSDIARHVADKCKAKFQTVRRRLATLTK